MTPTTTGRYEELDGTPIVRFERTFPHPVGEVWDAITDPARLEAWFPTSVEYARLEPGGPITFRFAHDAYPPMYGSFREVDVPARLAFTWGEDLLTFALAPAADDGCRLSFTVQLDAAGKAARDSAGWDERLDMLDEVLAGGAPVADDSGSSKWASLYEQYKAAGLPATAEIPTSHRR